MPLKNKGALNDGRKSGTLQESNSYWHDIQKGPLMFANSDEYRKLANRNKKNRKKR